MEEIPFPTTVWMYKNPANHGIFTTNLHLGRISSNYQPKRPLERGLSFQKGKDSCLPVPPFQTERKEIASFDRGHIFNRPKNVDIMEKYEKITNQLQQFFLLSQNLSYKSTPKIDFKQPWKASLRCTEKSKITGTPLRYAFQRWKSLRQR